jgi:hypothetical protein
MEVDNFDEPDAHFTGRIIDKTTGENILADQGAGRVKIWEKSFSLNPGSQTIPVKQDGTFNNTKLFKGTYDVVPEGAWWPADTIRIGIGKKAVHDFEVTPYLKLIDLKTEWWMTHWLSPAVWMFLLLQRDFPNSGYTSFLEP